MGVGVGDTGTGSAGRPVSRRGNGDDRIRRDEVSMRIGGSGEDSPPAGLAMPRSIGRAPSVRGRVDWRISAERTARAACRGGGVQSDAVAASAAVSVVVTGSGTTDW